MTTWEVEERSERWGESQGKVENRGVTGAHNSKQGKKLWRMVAKELALGR